MFLLLLIAAKLTVLGDPQLYEWNSIIDVACLRSFDPVLVVRGGLLITTDSVRCHRSPQVVLSHRLPE